MSELTRVSFTNGNTARAAHGRDTMLSTSEMTLFAVGYRPAPYP